MFKSVDLWLAQLQRISATQKLFFIQQLGIMLKAGIPLAKILAMLSSQTRNRRWQTVLAAISNDVLQGSTLAAALQKQPRIFDDLFVSMVKAGETSGTLEDVLKQLYIQLKKNHRLMSKVRGALAYPLIVLAAMSFIGAGVMIFVVPKFITIFDQVDAELPLMTQALIGLSNAIINNGLITAAITLFTLISVVLSARTSTGRMWLHWWILKMPIIAPIIQKINLARFARTMSSLLKTDIKIVEAFSITAATLQNVHYRQSLRETAAKIVKGNTIAEVLGQYPSLYNPTILQMIAVGEESGELDSILHEVADFYEEEVQTIMETLPTLIEPLIIIVLAVGIGAMAIAIIMPMYSLTNAF